MTESLLKRVSFEWSQSEALYYILFTAIENFKTKLNSYHHYVTPNINGVIIKKDKCSFSSCRPL